MSDSRSVLLPVGTLERVVSSRAAGANFAPNLVITVIMSPIETRVTKPAHPSKFCLVALSRPDTRASKSLRLRIRGAGPGRKREGVGRIALPDGFSNGDMWCPFTVLLLVGLREFTTLGQEHEAFPDPDLHYKGERADGASR
jgi:hypothetical protein